MDACDNDRNKRAGRTPTELLWMAHYLQEHGRQDIASEILSRLRQLGSHAGKPVVVRDPIREFIFDRRDEQAS